MKYAMIKYLTILMCITIFFSIDMNGKKKNSINTKYSLPELECTNPELDTLIKNNILFAKYEGYDNSYQFLIQAFNHNDSNIVEFHLLEKNILDFNGALGYLHYDGFNCIVSSQIELENLTHLFRPLPDGNLLELKKCRSNNPILICETDVFLWIYHITNNNVKLVSFFHKYALKNNNYNCLGTH